MTTEGSVLEIGKASRAWLPGVLVVVLAFLTASFLARNSDLWFHLAAGRLVAGGQLFAPADPFAYTAPGPWVDRSWLFDLGLYALHGVLGGTGLVVLKALLVAGLAAVLLRIRRDGAVWLPALCTSLAILAMSPRLQLQPVCVSYFLLGLTFWLLWRGQARPGVGGYPWLLMIFALWANVDEWSLLGPLLAGLFWLGERLGGERRTPGWLLPAGLAVCLLNPGTYHAFTLPAELSPVTWSSGLRQDPRFGRLFASPWRSGSLRPADLAYFALTALGVLSFLLHRPGRRDWRLVVWLPLAVLAGWQARAIPFFAVVAAPITALNLQDALAGRTRQARYLALAGRLSLILALLAAIGWTGLGWQIGAGKETGPIAWGIRADPSLQHLAESMNDWRGRGLLREGERVFAVAPEVAHYGAWFSAGERHFFDHRFDLFRGTARDYEKVCQALLPGLGSETEADWRQVLRDHHVGVVVLFSDQARLFASSAALSAQPETWTLLHVAGQAVVFGWDPARAKGGFAAQALDAERLAFGPPDERASRELPAAPGRGLEHLPSRATFWERLLGPPPPPTWESAAATVYLHRFEVSDAGQGGQQMRASLAACAASLAGLAALPPGIPLLASQAYSSRSVLYPDAASSTFLVRDQLGPFFRHLADRSPALPLLAVRAARRAVAAHPRDSNAWLRLGQAYLLLRDGTCERSAEGTLPPLTQLRFVQIVTALEEAVRLDPDLEVAHHELGYLYGERNAVDKALEHRRAELRLGRRAGKRPGESGEEAAHRLGLVERDVAKLELLVRELRDKYARSSRALGGQRVQQAQMALQLGLAGQALEEVLLPTPGDLLGLPGVKLELELLLLQGRADEVREPLHDPRLHASKHALPPVELPPPRYPDGTVVHPVPYQWPAWEWLEVLRGSAVGDYESARESLRTIRAGLRAGGDRLKQRLADLEEGQPKLLGGLMSGPSPFLPAYSAGALVRMLERKTTLEHAGPAWRAQEADLCAIEGLLALEQGATQEARAAFAEARRISAAGIAFAAAPIVGGYWPKLGRQVAGAPR